MSDNRKLITAAELEAEIRRQAEQSPDLVYRRRAAGWACRYLPSADRPETGCQVGSALTALGVPDTVLAAMDGRSPAGPDAGVGWTEDPAEEILGDWLDPFAIQSQWVLDVQNNQDDGCSRAEAVVRADYWRAHNNGD